MMNNLQNALPNCSIPAGTRLSVKIDGEIKSVMTKGESFFLNGEQTVHVYGYGVDQLISTKEIVNPEKVTGWRFIQIDSPTLIPNLIEQLEEMTVLAKKRCPDEAEAIRDSELLVLKARTEILSN